jgi:hypothetical protein
MLSLTAIICLPDEQREVLRVEKRDIRHTILRDGSDLVRADIDH